MSALDEARALANLASGREGPETNEQAALVAIAYGLIAITEALSAKTNGYHAEKINQLSDENLDLRLRINELETYHGPNCPRCGAQNQIPLSTRAQCPQCNKVYTVS